MDKKTIKLLWIDRHCIPQQTCKSHSCNHKACHRKEAGLQCMDSVYKCSNYPVALLGRPLEKYRKLILLRMILKGEFVNRSDAQNQFQLSPKINSRQVTDALKLLFAITSDLWWQRAWTFQENYKGGEKMVLHIRHPENLERLKIRYGIFGDVPGELCVNSRHFSHHATMLCRAYQGTRHPMRKEREMTESILSKAGRYKLLLDESQTMSPTIITNVEERDVSKVWDRLAIVGNCCSYPVRMDIERLRQSGHSLSLSMLAMCLLNGEILKNRPSDGRTAFDISISEFLQLQSFDNMSSPREQRGLTFNKGSRFIDVKLDKSGITTSGHIWELSRIIQTRHFNSQLPWVKNPRGGLELLEQRRLARLSQELEKFPESTTLSHFIANYLKEDAISRTCFRFGENYMMMMMVEVSNAIGEGKALRLGRLSGLEQSTAIFIWDSDHKPGLIFTSSRPKNLNSEGHRANGTDHHVSLEVELKSGSGQIKKSPPHLYIKRWVFGICFFMECPRREVVFSWPPALRNIGS
ncbi:hypothetical protein F4859DRAFT_529562 [Xylaria cf. heliscus]|nr:hypothetical protein F4859DRAFT_529562 [Xylaria cf. heliscus]